MKRILSLLLVILLAVSMLPWSASAASVTKKETKRAIAIAFDNSGSMYQGTEDSRQAWCRATYAMEAFANMMNTNDVMQIYPMHPITIGKSGGTQYTMQNPLTITQKDAATIREIFTPDPQGTPIQTIPAALEGIKKVSADEKWLIVLSDGTTFDENISFPYGTYSESETAQRLGEELTKCRQEVNVMYLGIGKDAAEPKNVTGSYKYVFEKASSSTDVLNKLSSMCNTIFGRKTLQGSGNSFEFDVSMSKLILFVQGDGISNVDFGGLKAVDSAQLKHATGGCNGRNPLDDTTLQGVMITYQNVDAGALGLTYSGTASNVVCYYEPDVDLFAEFRDANGTVVNPNSEMIAGEYTLNFGMVDKNGKETTSSLLGSTKYVVTYTLNGEEHTVEADKAGQIKLTLQPGDVLDAKFKVTYLDGYTITRTSADLGWPEGGLHFEAPAAGKLEVSLSGGQSDYKLSTLTSGESFGFTFVYDGTPLSVGQLDSMERLDITIEGGNGVEGLQNVTATRQGDKVTIGFGGGDALHTQCGEYTLTVSGVYRNEDDKLTNTAAASAKFTVTDDSEALNMTVTATQSFYQISEIANGAPIVVTFDFSGRPLTEEELKAFDPTLSNLQAHIIKEMDVASSSYILRFDPTNPPAEGDYTIVISSSGVNQIGRPQQVKEEVDVEFSVLPLWLKILIPIAIILIILLIIWSILNMKVLPKNVAVLNGELSVDGTKLKGAKAYITNPGKKEADIVITSPKYAMDPGATQQITLSVRAVTNRLKPNEQRQYEILDIKFKGAAQVREWEVKGAKYKADRDKPGNFKSVVNNGPFKPIPIAGPKTTFSMKVETKNEASVTFKGTLINQK